jgi:DedD protein
MDKEMRKLLLVSLSVGVFLVVIISASILILTPKVQTEETAFSSSHPIPTGRLQYDPTDILRNQNDFLGIQPIPEISEGITSESTFEFDRREGDRVTIVIPRPGTTEIPSIIPESKPSVTPAVTVVQAPVETKPVTTPAVQPPVRTAQPAASTRPINDYWVQTGAFTAIVRAENAKEMLASKGITSIIENRQIDGTTWYRVRVGPYTTENEAKYWLALVQAIDGFGESQVRQTTR